MNINNKLHKKSIEWKYRNKWSWKNNKNTNNNFSILFINEISIEGVE